MKVKYTFKTDQLSFFHVADTFCKTVFRANIAVFIITENFRVEVAFTWKWSTNEDKNV